MTTNSFWRVFSWPYRTVRAIFYGSDGSNLSNSGLFDHTTDNEPIYFEQGTDTTTPFTDSMTASWGSGATGYYGGSTGYWPPTTAMPMATTPPPPDIQNKPKPLEIPDLDAPRVINLD
ncbi:MAG: hypothetical protein WC919_00885 [Candidatus Paceibacterota bacterium]